MDRFRKPRNLLATLLLGAACAQAGEFNDLGGVALKGHDPVAYFSEKRAVPGDSAIRHEYQGSTFVFANAANRDAFAADPGKYAPQYGGYCAFGASRGYKADVDPAAFSIVEGKLYLNYNPQVQKEWLKDPAGYIRRADERWADTRATTKVHR